MNTRTEIEYMDHRKFRLGDRIEVYVGGDIRTVTGPITEITDNGHCKIAPEGDLTGMPRFERWPTKTGDGWYVKCRDHGVPGGNILRRVSRGRAKR